MDDVLRFPARSRGDDFPVASKGTPTGSGDAEDALLRAAVERVRRGDDEAFAVVVHSLGTVVAQSLARRIPAQDVQEVAQDVFVRAYRSLAGWRGESGFKTWILSIARLAAADHWRRHYRRRDVVMADFDEAGQVGVEAAHQAALAGAAADARRKAEARQTLETGLARLSPEDRAVITMVELDGMSMADAARELGCGLSAAKVRAFRARKRLRKALEAVMAERKDGMA